MSAELNNGTIRTINAEQRIFYDGQWIRYYKVPHNLAYKKQLIDQLTRRVFHHTEPGINTPGERLEVVRAAYENMDEPSQKRVLAAMLAGALLNRGSDILTKIVELEQVGVVVDPKNELVRECGRCFMGALEYGKNIRPLHGHEELDELWGEPFKAFTLPIKKFLESRYIKTAHTMTDIDTIANTLIKLFEPVEMFAELPKKIKELSISAKLASETMRSDPANIVIWPRLVGAADKLAVFKPLIPEGTPRRMHSMGKRGSQLIQDGAGLIVELATIRTQKPKSTSEFLKRCDKFSKRYLISEIR